VWPPASPSCRLYEPEAVGAIEAYPPACKPPAYKPTGWPPARRGTILRLGEKRPRREWGMGRREMGSTGERATRRGRNGRGNWECGLWIVKLGPAVVPNERDFRLVTNQLGVYTISDQALGLTDHV
jgi:hypothetical protein